MGEIPPVSDATPPGQLDKISQEKSPLDGYSEVSPLTMKGLKRSGCFRMVAEEILRGSKAW